MYYNDADYAISEEESSSSGQVIIGDNADSEDDAQDLNELDGVVSKKRGIARAYNLIDNFQSLSEAKSCMDALDAFKWKRGKTNKGLECNKLTYKCIESLDCPTLAYILLDNTSLNCSVFKSDDEHQHNQLGKTTGIDSRVKDSKA